MNGKQRIVSALNRQPVDRTPVWFMRQAGRHLPEYRKIAAEHNFWERCMDVDLCKAITLQPIERYQKIDAAIIFSDILTPLPSLGYDVGMVVASESVNLVLMMLMTGQNSAQGNTLRGLLTVCRRLVKKSATQSLGWDL